MGLDSVELVMEIEKAFDIRIPDQEAEKIITVGDFYNTVWKHLDGKHSDRCQSQKLFYLLRQAFFDSFLFPKEQFNLTTPLNDILPQNNRREVYTRLSGSINIKFPELVLPKPWAVFLNTVGMITIAGALVLSLILINFLDHSKWTLLFPVAGICLTLFVSATLDPKRTIIEPATAGEFTQKTLALNFAALMNKGGTNRKEMESVINQVIADKVGLDLEEITAEKKLCDDLGID